MKRFTVFPSIPPTAQIGIPAPTFGAAGVSTTEVDLTASYSGPPAFVTFTFEYSTAIGGPFSVLATQASGSYSHTGLVASTTYYYRCNVQVSDGRPSMYSFTNGQTLSSGGTADLYPHTAMVTHGGNRRYDTEVNFNALAPRRHLVSVNVYNGWEAGKTKTFPQIISGSKAASTLAIKPRWFDYQIMDEPQIVDIGASNPNSPWATKCNSEKWFLYTILLTGTPVLWNGVAGKYGSNITTFPAVDAGGKKPYQWFVDWIYGWQVLGAGSNVANSVLDGPFCDSINQRVKFAADWNIDGTTDAADGGTGSGAQSQWVRNGMAAYGAYQRGVWGSTKYVLGNMGEYTLLSRITTGIENTFHSGLMESFMGPASSREYSSTFGQLLQSYTKIRDLLLTPNWVIWHHQTLSSATGQDTESGTRGDPNWQAARFGACASQLTNAYYWPSIDSNYATEDVFETDEMVCGTAGPEALGPAVDSETTAMTVYQHISGSGSTSDDIYRRRFANGEIYVRPRANNSGASAAVTTPATVNFGGTRYRLRGIKETTVNNASSGSSYTFNRDRDAVMVMYNPT